MRTFLGFVMGVLTTLVVLGVVVIWNCFGVYTTTKVVYNPESIVSMFGSYTESVSSNISNN